MPKLQTPHQWARTKTPDQWANHHMTMVIILIVIGVFCSYPVAAFFLDSLGVAHHDKLQASTSEPPTPAIGGSGVVVSKNEITGLLTIQHHGVAALGWGAGPATFAAPPVMLKRVAVGDQVNFGLTQVNGYYVVTSVDVPAFRDRILPR